MITPQEQVKDLGKTIGLSDSEVLYFKREDLHPYSSHKGRSIPVMVDHYVAAGESRFAITGSGNAALAAALHIKKLNKEMGPLSLDIFVGNNIAPSKLAKIKKLADENIRVLTKEMPLQALTQAINEGVRSLRQSTDDKALLGYETLGEELTKIGKIGAVFIGTSSGTTAQALAAYFIKHKISTQVHIVQTSSCHPMAQGFESYDGPEEKSIADAIVDITAQRKPILVPLIEQTLGRGWIVTNENIKAAQELTKKHAGLDISTNSALSVAGLMKAVAVGYEMKGAIVCMICGD